MTETRTTYHAGSITLIPAPRSLRNDCKPTLDELEQQGRQLKAKQDRLWLEIGNWAVTVSRYYGANAYERLLAVCGFDNQATMVEDWAYTCRNVPLSVQRPELSYSHHRAVAPVKDRALQVELLQFAIDRALTANELRAYIKNLTGNSDEPPPPPPGNKSDRLFETEKELIELELKYQEERKKRSEAEEQLALLQNTFSTVPDSPHQAAPRVADAGRIAERIRTLVLSLSVAEFLKSPEREFGRVVGELQRILEELEG